MSNNNNVVNENVASGPGAEISDKITAQGDLVRQLKSDKKPKEEIEAAVKVLLALKVDNYSNENWILKFVFDQDDYKKATGSDWQPAGGASSKQKKPAKESKPKEKVDNE